MANARIAKTFQIDPVDLFRDGGDEFLMMLRSACMMVVQRDEKEANDKASRK